MNNLQKGALKQIIELSQSLMDEIIATGSLIDGKKEEFNSQKHMIPLARKAGNIKNWAEETLESIENPK